MNPASQSPGISNIGAINSGSGMPSYVGSGSSPAVGSAYNLSMPAYSSTHNQQAQPALQPQYNPDEPRNDSDSDN